MPEKRNPQALTDLAKTAMDKIRDEMAESKIPAVTGIGEIMTELLAAMPTAATKILADGKTLSGAYAAMEKWAKDNKHGSSCVCVGPEKAREIILSYYGIDAAAPEQAKPAAPAADDLDLDALLGV